MTGFILAATLVVSFLAFRNPALYEKFIFNPFAIYHQNEWYRFLTGGLIHADWIHLLVNMFVLYSFGNIVEEYYNEVFGDRSTVYFILLYVGGLMTSVLPTYNKHKTNPAYNALGASGAVSAVVFAFILFNPLQQLYLYGILHLPGIIFGVLYIAYCYYMGKKGGDNINHDAHLWGAVYGFCFTALMKPAIFLAFFDKLTFFRDAI